MPDSLDPHDSADFQFGDLTLTAYTLPASPDNVKFGLNQVVQVLGVPKTTDFHKTLGEDLGYGMLRTPFGVQRSRTVTLRGLCKLVFRSKLPACLDHQNRILGKITVTNLREITNV